MVVLYFCDFVLKLNMQFLSWNCLCIIMITTITIAIRMKINIQAMLIMELPVGAKKEKKEVALSNLSAIMDRYLYHCHHRHHQHCHHDDDHHRRAHAVRAPGPAALDIAWVGAGAADCFFHFGCNHHHHDYHSDCGDNGDDDHDIGIHCWDMAAGALIVSEAGGVVSLLFSLAQCQHIEMRTFGKNNARIAKLP